MNEYADIAEGMLSEREDRAGGMTTSQPEGVGRISRDVEGPKAQPQRTRSENTHVELDAVGIPKDAKMGKASTETVKRSRKKGCTADVPAGTRCKICGELHPQRTGRSVRIHVPGRDIDAKTDFKKERRLT